MILLSDPKFWLSISFIVFALLFVKFVFPFILGKIDSRLKQVIDSIKLAENALKEAQKLLDDAEKLYKNSIKSAKSILIDADNESASLLKRSY